MSLQKPLGVIAGSGSLPVLLAREMDNRRPLVVVGVSTDPQPELERRASHFERMSIGKIHAMLSTFEKSGASELVILGGVEKDAMFNPRRLDWLAVKIIAKARTRGDQALFAAIVEEFEARGFTVADQRAYLPSLTPSEGVLTKRKPKRGERADAAYALELARRMAALDVGQTVIVKDGVPLAVEAMEGTDAAIRRGAALGGEGVVVGKACRPDHDFRFDAPTVGLETVRTLAESKAAALVLEAERTFLLDRDRFIAEADRAGIAALALAKS